LPGPTLKDTPSAPRISPLLLSRKTLVRSLASIIPRRCPQTGGLQAHPLAEVLGLPPAELDLGAPLQLDEEPAAEPGLDPRDPGGVDDLAPVGPEEELGIQPLLHRVEGSEELRLGVAEVDARVVALALEEPDLAHLDEPAPVPVAHKHPVPRLELAGGFLPAGRRLEPWKALHGGGEPCRVDGLEKVVERIELEGLHRELVVGRREDHVRHRGLEGLEELHPGLARHLHVEEEDVGLERRHLLAGLLGVGRLARHPDLRVRHEQAPQLVAREALVVDQERLHQCAERGITASATTWSGSPSARSRSVALSPKISRSLSAALCRPTPVDDALPLPTIRPGLVTWMRSSPPELRAMMAISPPSGLGEIPYLTAFSTRVCRSIGGMRRWSASGAMSSRSRSRSSWRTCSRAR